MKKGVRLEVLFSILILFTLFLASDVKATTIFSETFESGTLGGWTLSNAAGANNWTASSTDPFQGSFHAQSLPQSTTEPASVIERVISTSGYNNIIINYTRKLIGLDAADEFQMEWFDGTSWAILELTGSSAADDLSYLSKQFSLPSGANNNANLKIKFECTAGAVSEFCRVDNVLILGDIIDSTPPIVTINFPTNGSFYKSTLNFNVSLNENGSIIYSLNGGINNKSMTGSEKSQFGLNFNATNNSIADGTYTFQVYANDTNGNKNYTTTAQFTYDTINPLLKIIRPQNTSYNTTSLQINFTISDTNLQSCWYTDNNEQTNISLSNCQNTSYSASQGSTTIKLYANDSAGNTNSSSVTFFVDSIIPLISLTSPTQANNSILAQNSIFINTTITEINFANITFSLYNSTSLVNQTTFNSQILSINFTSLPNSIYFYNVTLKDSLNNQNTTETRTITLDTIAPTLIINSPQNTTYTNSTILVNITSNGDNIWFYNGTANETYTSPIYRTFSQGTNTIIAYTNDSVGNTNSTSITYFIDSIIPDLSIIQPSEGATFGTNTSLQLNFSAVDTNLQSCWYHIDSSNNITIPNCQNTTFNTSSGSHTLYLYANDTLNNKGLKTVNFTISIGAPSISISSPSGGAYINTTNIQFIYTATDVDLQTCELWGNFTGTFAKNQTNTTIISGQSSSFSLSIPDSSYVWNIKCNDTLGNNAISGNRTLNIDTVFPTITLSEPSGTKTSRNNIPLTFSASDANLQSCQYNLYRGSSLEITNTTISCSSTTKTFNVTVDASFTLNLYANDSAGNTNLVSSSFIVDTSTPPNDGGPSGGGGGGGGSGSSGSGGGGIAPKKPQNSSRNLEFNIKPIENTTIKRGTNKKLELEITNKEKTFINNCKLKILLELNKFVTNDQTKGLSPGERFKFILGVNVPNNADIGKVKSNLIIECDEGHASTSLELSIYRNSFEINIINYERETDKLKIKYLIEEFAQTNHNISIKHELRDSNQLLVSEGIESLILQAGQRQENILEISLPKGLTGKFDLKLLVSDETTKNELKENVDLTSKLTGFTISQENRRTLSIFGIILVSITILFFVSRFVYRRYQKIKPPHLKNKIEEKNGRKLIKIDIKGNH